MGIDLFKLKHSYKSGDFISLMPGLQKIYKEKGKKWRIYQRINLPEFQCDNCKQYVSSSDETKVCMSERMFNLLKPLIESQEYIESFNIWGGETFDIDIDLSRESNLIPMPGGMLHHYPWTIAPELACDLSIPWLKVHPMGYCNTTDGIRQLSEIIIVNRTDRYTNPYITYFFLKEYENNIVFSGTEKEWTSWCSTQKLNVPLIVTEDFLELARAIGSCKLILSNASMAWHISDALKTNRILELSRSFPNTFPTGNSGYAFYSQRALEFYVSKLMQ
jgi:hypothetical protein